MIKTAGGESGDDSKLLHNRAKMAKHYTSQMKTKKETLPYAVAKFQNKSKNNSLVGLGRLELSTSTM